MLRDMSRSQPERHVSSYYVPPVTLGQLMTSYARADPFYGDPLGRDDMRLVHAGRELNRGQLNALGYDGVLQPVIASVFAERQPRTMAERSQALALMIEDSWGQDPVFCRWSAAWLYGACAAPKTVEFLSKLYVHPARDHRTRDFQAYQLNLPAEEHWRVGEVLAISPVQCAAELLVHVNNPPAWVAAGILLKTKGLLCPRKIRHARHITERLGLLGQRRAAQQILDQWLEAITGAGPIVSMVDEPAS